MPCSLILILAVDYHKYWLQNDAPIQFDIQKCAKTVQPIMVQAQPGLSEVNYNDLCLTNAHTMFETNPMS